MCDMCMCCVGVCACVCVCGECACQTLYVSPITQLYIIDVTQIDSEKWRGGGKPYTIHAPVFM